MCFLAFSQNRYDFWSVLYIGFPKIFPLISTDWRKLSISEGQSSWKQRTCRDLWEAVTSPGNRDTQSHSPLCSWSCGAACCSQPLCEPHFCITVPVNLLSPLKILILYWDPLTSPCKCLGISRNTPKAQHLQVGWLSLQSVLYCGFTQRFPSKSPTLIRLLRLWILSLSYISPSFPEALY